MGKFIDLTGMQFGKWTVLERAPNRGTTTYWRCQCECERVIDVAATSLRKGHSEGCHRCQAPFDDLTGRRFGYWKVLHRDHQVIKKRLRWLCLCDPEYGGCGQKVLVVGASLRRGVSTRCRKCYKQDGRRLTERFYKPELKGKCVTCRVPVFGNVRYCSESCRLADAKEYNKWNSGRYEDRNKLGEHLSLLNELERRLKDGETP